MVAIEHRQQPSNTTASSQQQQQLEPLEPLEQLAPEAALTETSANIQHSLSQHCTDLSDSGTMSKNEVESADLMRKHREAAAAAIAKSAVSQRNVDIQIANKSSSADVVSQELTKKVLKLDLTSQELDEFSLKSPKSPISARLPHQTSLTSSVDVEDRKTLREALYQGIFHRHRRTIFAVGSFLRMLRSRNSQYNTIRSSSEGEDVDEPR